VRICLVYDCLYPWTVGGAERWYRNLAERLAVEGHEVTYLTRRQWEDADPPKISGVRVLAVSPRAALYAGGRRRVAPPLVFGLGVFRHLVRQGRHYDLVHTASFPYFSVLAAGGARPLGRFRLVVDWHEVWTREYWREYLGPLGGAVGWLVQRLCLAIPQRAFCFSRLHEQRLRELRVNGAVTRLEGEYAGPLEVAAPVPAEPVVVFAGRHIPEKRVLSLVPAIARAAEEIPELRCEIYGDGPEREQLLEAIEAAGLGGRISAPGFVEAERIEAAMRRALCLVLPSRREGYGVVIVEAAALGTPSVVVAGPDNAAAELVEEGVNGFVAPSASAEDLAATIVRVHRAGSPLRESTAAWFAANAERLSIERSLEAMLVAYAPDTVTSHRPDAAGAGSPRT
jgi:glycosyltransferase involved in cell wall biosynthesis